jgi:hypothetical protein
VCETTVLVAVSAFGVNVGAFYQCIVMTAALALVMYLLLAFLIRLRAHRLAAACFRVCNAFLSPVIWG